jgi:CHAT domain-containing protein
VDLLRARWDSAAATALSAALLAPLAGHLDGVELLTIVPDGPLHVLPFDALPFGDAQVVDAFATRLLASLVDLNGASRPPPPGPIAIIGAAGGDGAAEAEREARLVARVLGVRRVRVLAGEQLTRQEVASALSGARLVHIAAHARTNDSRPEYAYLELHGGPGGRWHAREIERVALPDALVVLSACETAGGALLDTEGTLSLSRAFLRAGARATVATLWPIGAATEPLMETFYGALTPDRSVAEALRLARLELRSTHPHPFYWAPFVLTERRE